MTTHTDDFYERLEGLARTATGGDWRAYITQRRSPEIYTNVPPPNTPNPLIAGTILRKHDAAYIAAANPQAILKLIAENRAYREALPDLSAVIAWLQNGCDPVHAITELAIHKGRIERAIANIQQGGQSHV